MNDIDKKCAIGSIKTAFGNQVEMLFAVAVSNIASGLPIDECVEKFTTGMTIACDLKNTLIDALEDNS